MQINFKTYERIVKNKIEETKQKYFFDRFTAQKNDMKKTWGTILPCADKTLYLMFRKLLRRAILETSLISLHTLVIYRV